MNLKIRIALIGILIGLASITIYACAIEVDKILQIFSGPTEKATVEKIYDPSFGIEPTGRLKATLKLESGDSNFDIDAVPGLQLGKSIYIVRYFESAAPMNGGWLNGFFVVNELSLNLGLLMLTVGVLFAISAPLASKRMVTALLCFWISICCCASFAWSVVITALDLGFPFSALPALLPAMFFVGCAVYWDPKRIYAWVMNSSRTVK